MADVRTKPAFGLGSNIGHHGHITEKMMLKENNTGQKRLDQVLEIM